MTSAASSRATGQEPGRPVAAARETGALALLIDVDAETFATRHWGRAPLLTQNAAFAAAGLFDAAAVDELVSRRGLRTPFLRMAKEGRVIPAARFTRSGGAGAGVTDQVADDKVLELLGDGATLVVQALHRAWPPLVDFAARLSSQLGHPVQVNAYVTPPQNQGFASHYDVHDVFVLQIAGGKRWRVHAPVFPAPLREHDWEQHKDAIAAATAQPPLIDIELAPGDCLYLPRGYLHSAEALGETSIHLTVGVHPLTRHQLVEELTKAAKNDPELRASLPMGVDLTDPVVLAPILRSVAEALRRSVDAVRPEEVAEAVAADLAGKTRPEPLAPLAALDAAAGLDGRSPLHLRHGLRPRFTRGEDELRITLLDKTISLPLASEAALKAVLSGSTLTPRDLPGLEPEEQLTLARRLLREGVLVPGSA